MDNLTYMQPRIGNDTASVGYYKTNLQNGVTAEMSATSHAGILQYTYPVGGQKYILVDVSHYLPTQDEPIAEQFYSNGMIETSEDGSMYSGYGIWRGGWNEGWRTNSFVVEVRQLIIILQARTTQSTSVVNLMSLRQAHSSSQGLTPTLTGRILLMLKQLSPTTPP